MLVWQAHKGRIESAAFSADGRLLATATGGTRLVHLWEPSTGKLVRKLNGDWPSGVGLGAVKSVCFAPQAPLLAAGTDRSVTVWHADTLELLADLRVSNAHELAFGPGDAPALAASSIEHLAVWDDAGCPTGETGRTIERLVGSRGHVAALDFSPDGRTLATSTAWRADLWEAATGRNLRSLRTGNVGNRGAVRFAPDGTRLAMAYAKWVEVREVVGDSPVVKVQAGTGRFPNVWAVSWTADGRAFLTAGNDGAVRLWDATTGAEQKTFDWGIGKLYCAAFSPDGLTCAACGEKGKVVVWDVDN
jgi:WD40 repeat protein